MKNTPNGYTFIEVVVAVALMAVLAVLAVPNLTTQSSHLHLMDAGRQVLSDLRLIRQRAIMDQMPHQAAFQAGTPTYILSTLGARSLPPQVRFGAAPHVPSISGGPIPADGLDFSGDQNTAIFQATGRFSGLGATIYLTDDPVGNETIALTVIRTGRVRIRRFWQGEWTD